MPDTTDPSVKGGMSVTVNIITQIASDALVVPNAAVKTQTGGGSYVQVLQNGKPTDVTVQVGISNDTYTQITSGLTVGQEVVTATINPSASTSTTIRRGGGGIGVPRFRRRRRLYRRRRVSCGSAADEMTGRYLRTRLTSPGMRS